MKIGGAERCLSAGNMAVRGRGWDERGCGVGDGGARIRDLGWGLGDGG